jgi:hypothetical protein
MQDDVGVRPSDLVFASGFREIKLRQVFQNEVFVCQDPL